MSISNLTPEDIQAGYNMARDDIDAVRRELEDTGSKLKFQGISGEERKKFLSDMTADEFKRLKLVADSLDALGYNGNHALEKLLREAEGLVE